MPKVGELKEGSKSLCYYDHEFFWFCMLQHDTGNVHMDFVLGYPLMFHLSCNLDLAFVGPVLFVGKLRLVKG